MFNMKMGVGGRFQITVRDAETGKVKHETPWFDNMVLDQGLDGMATQSWFTNIAVGTGGGETTAQMTNLKNRLNVSPDTNNVTYGYVNTATEKYNWARRAVRFDAGRFNNVNLAEVGATMYDGKMWNRALILDTAGQPTTITVSPTDYLDITAEVRIYLPAQPVVSSVAVKDKNGNVIDTLTVSTNAHVTSSPGVFIRSLNSWWNSYVFDRFVFIYGNNKESGYVPVYTTYQPGSYLYKFYLKIDVLSINDVDIKKMKYYAVNLSTGVSNRSPGFSFEFQPYLRKNKTQSLTFNFTWSWGRYAAG